MHNNSPKFQGESQLRSTLYRSLIVTLYVKSLNSKGQEKPDIILSNNALTLKYVTSLSTQMALLMILKWIS